jgi:hypothetical protein
LRRVLRSFFGVFFGLIFGVFFGVFFGLFFCREKSRVFLAGKNFGVFLRESAKAAFLSVPD